MKYMGSKNRISKDILPIMLEYRQSEEQFWVEPFVGGANMIDKVGGNRLGSDSNRHLIALLKKMQESEFTPPLVTEEEYYNVKKQPELYQDWYVAFVGIQLSYGAKWFNSYRRDSEGKRNYALEAKKNIEKQMQSLKGVLFKHCDYQELKIPPNSIIYCDPPYENTGMYEAVGHFNHQEFWDWCRQRANEGHIVFISEYDAPSDFKCIWSKELNTTISRTQSNKKPTEKLFTKHL